MPIGLVARIGGVFVAAAAAACLAATVDAVALTDMARQARQLLAHDMVNTLALLRSQNHLERANGNVLEAVLTGRSDTAALERGVRTYMADYGTRMAEMRAASHLGAREADELAPGLQAIETALDRSFALIHAGRLADARAALAGSVSPAVERQVARGRIAVDRNWAQLEAARKTVLALAGTRTIEVAMLVAVPVMTALIGLLWLAGPGLRRPMRRLMAATERLRAGDLDRPVGMADRTDEVGAIAMSLDMLRQEALRARALDSVAQAQAAAARAQVEAAGAARLRDLADAAFEGLAIIENGIVIEANTSLAVMLGMERSRLLGMTFAALVPVEGSRLPHEVLAAAASGPLSVHLAHQGGPFPVELRARPLDPRGMMPGGRNPQVVAVRDLRSQAAAEARIRHLGQYDVLTGAANRALLRERLEDALPHASAAQTGFALLCIDLDRFKPVNDLHGHTAGDRVLCEVQRRLQVNTRAADTVARLGGDEFVVLQAGVRDVDQAIELGRRLVAALRKDYDIGNGETVSLTASIGIAIYPDDGALPDALLASADSALYRVKRSSRNDFALFQADVDAGLHARHVMEHDLRHALPRGEFSLAYQTQATCQSGRIAGFEALLRWNQETRGMVSPADFIPVAEDTDMIVDIGAWVLRTACAEAARWAVPLRIAVNVSPRQLVHVGFTQLVADTLAETGLEPCRLELEVTEGLLIQKTEQALAVINALKDVGVQVALDDFGTGYSSLVTLRSFPFDRVKVDRTFVQHLTESEEARAIIRAVVALGQALNIPILAEGVETQAQFDALRDEGCDEVQGYLIGRPMDIASLRHITHPTTGVTALPLKVADGALSVLLA